MGSRHELEAGADKIAAENRRLRSENGTLKAERDRVRESAKVECRRLVEERDAARAECKRLSAVHAQTCDALAQSRERVARLEGALRMMVRLEIHRDVDEVEAIRLAEMALAPADARGEKATKNCPHGLDRRAKCALCTVEGL